MKIALVNKINEAAMLRIEPVFQIHTPRTGACQISAVSVGGDARALYAITCHRPHFSQVLSARMAR